MTPDGSADGARAEPATAKDKAAEATTAAKARTAKVTTAKGTTAEATVVQADRPRVGIVGGSRSDFPVLERAAALLTELGIPNELRVVSAHRTPDLMFDYAASAIDRGLEVIIAGAGGAAHLPGMIAAKTRLPVIGVPIPTQHLGGLDSLLSIVQMPRGVPVATVAIGNAENAALLAARIVALGDPTVRERLIAYRADQERMVLNDASNR